MNHLIDWMEKRLLPLANSFAQIRYLVALRNAFVSIILVTISGSLAVLIKGLIQLAQDKFGWHTFDMILSPLSAISNIVWRGSFSLFALFLAVSLGYQLAKTFEANRIAGAIVSLASFMMSIANYAQIKVNGDNLRISHAFAISQFSSAGIFTAILFGSLGFFIYLLCYRARVGIHLEVNVPHAERAAFEALIPGIVALFGVGSLNYLFQTLTGTYFGNWLLKAIQLPLIKMGQGFGMVILVCLLVQVFSFFGLSGLSVLAPIIDSIWLTAQNVNVTFARDGRLPKFSWVRGSFDVFVWMGGTGGTLTLIIAILLFSKKADMRALAKVAIAPGFFNINEPVLFGLPIVLNPIYFIPFVLTPLANVVLAYWAVLMGLVNPVQVAVPSIMPPIINAFLACNYDWRAIILAIINLTIGVLIWTPFVLASGKMKDQAKPRRLYMRQF